MCEYVCDTMFIGCHWKQGTGEYTQASSPGNKHGGVLCDQTFHVAPRGDGVRGGRTPPTLQVLL